MSASKSTSSSQRSTLKHTNYQTPASALYDATEGRTGIRYNIFCCFSVFFAPFDFLDMVNVSVHVFRNNYIICL